MLHLRDFKTEGFSTIKKRMGSFPFSRHVRGINFVKKKGKLNGHGNNLIHLMGIFSLRKISIFKNVYRSEERE